MLSLLLVMALLELLTGAALLGAPSLTVSLLVGSAPDSPAGLLAARVAGAAVLALGLACWFARDEGRGRAGRGLIVAMLAYNVAVAVILGYADLGVRLSANGLWPTIAVHLALASWCVVVLRRRSRPAL